MTTFLRRVLWPAFALLVALTLITGVVYPAIVTAVAQVAFPHQANGSIHRRQGRPDHRLEPDRPGVLRRHVLLGPPVRGRARRRLRRQRLGRLEPRADQPGPDRPHQRRASPAYQAANGGGADPGRPRHHVGVRARSRHQPRGGRVPGRPRRQGARHDRGRRPRGRRPPHRAAAARHPRPAGRPRARAQPRPGRARCSDRSGARRVRRPPHGGRDARARPGRRRRATAAGCASTSAWRPASARRSGCSRRAIGAETRGTDVVVGFVEAHGRPHTLELLDGLEVVPRQRIEYRGVVVEEMDTDAVIERRPTVALIDELAHTNVPGSARDQALGGRGDRPRRRDPRRDHAERPAPRERRRRRRHDHRRAGQRAPPRRGPPDGATRSSSST